MKLNIIIFIVAIITSFLFALFAMLCKLEHWYIANTLLKISPFLFLAVTIYGLFIVIKAIKESKLKSNQ